MGKRDKKIIIIELQDRLEKLPEWQKKATLEAIGVLETKEPTDRAMYINLRAAGHYDLADLYLSDKEREKQYGRKRI